MGQATYRVDLTFNTNAKAAKQQIKEIQGSLDSVINKSATSQLGLTPQLQQARQSAMELKIALNNAMSVDTGKLNLNTFMLELKKSGKSVEDFARDMAALGPEGSKTFMQVAKAVSEADTKVFQLSAGMKKLVESFANTARWTITSSIISGITNSISETVSYAKELDKSLNNIQIVTGKSADEMQRFAKEANKMAKQLATTTTKYTDASLIYYQQGLDSAAAKERTDTTIKLANVTGTSAQEVSEWMTAIWNNFDDGSESLEYYADVLAALGATTASSADEIAGGLEKFAAVADTIGLSYEYAASALATITAETRQSEDVVGTALKTIFSRMEQLKQGDTLDDGTSLGQYSLALQKVGVDIMDVSGELRNMDDILADTGERWQTLGRDQQIALAQSVAGIRQYTQFMALMDNWDVMQANVQNAKDAGGALAKQQYIYEQSVEASQERMEANAERIRATLLGGDDLKPLYDFAADALDIVGDLLESMGGMRGVILLIASALTKVYQPQIVGFIERIPIALKNMKTGVDNYIKTLKGEKPVDAFATQKTQFVETALNSASAHVPEQESVFMEQNLKIKQKMLEVQEQMDAGTRQRVEWEYSILKVKQEQVLAAKEALEVAREQHMESLDMIDEAGIDADAGRQLFTQAETKGRGEAAADLAMSTVSEAKGKNLTADSRGVMGDLVGGQIDALEQSFTDLDLSVENVDFSGIRTDLENFVSSGQGNLEDLIKKIEAAKKELSTAAGAKIADTKTSIAQTADSRASTGAAMTQSFSSGGITQAATVSKKLDKVDDKALNKQQKERLKQMKETAKAEKEEQKRLKTKIKQQKDLIKQGKAQKKDTKEQEKQLKKLNEQYKASEKRVKTLVGECKEFGSELSSAGSDADKFGEALEKTEKAGEDCGKGIQNVEAAENGVKEAGDDMIESLDNAGAGTENWANKLGEGLSNMTSFASGLTMMTSGFESLGKAIASGDMTMGDFLTSMTSILMGVMQMLPMLQSWSDGIGQVTTKIFAKTAAQKADIQVGNQDLAQAPAEIAKEQGEAASKTPTIFANIAKAFSGVAAQAGTGPPGWATAIASLAMIAPIVALVGGAMISLGSGGAAAKEEEQQETVDTGLDNLEKIDENQELATSVNDLTEEYKALSAAGMDTTEVLDEMSEQIPELINSYKELGTQLGTVFDTSKLEEAYEIFKATGDISLFQEEQAKLDEQVKNKEKETAASTQEAAQGLVKTAVDKQKKKGSKKKRNEQFADDMGEYWDSEKGIVSFDTSNTGETLDAYDKMLKARDKMIQQGETNTKEYEYINDLIESMSENVESLREASNIKFEIDKSELLETDYDEQLLSEFDISSVEGYTAAREKLIDKLMEEKEWTEEQAAAYLKASDALGGYEATMQAFGEDATRTQQIAANMGAEGLKQVKDWYAALPEADRTLALGINFSTVDSMDELNSELERIREQAASAAIVQEAVDLGVDKNDFETYTDLLVDNNAALEENNSFTKQIALNNIRLNKGIKSLVDNWGDLVGTLAEGNRNSMEYAEAIGSLKDSFEEAFEYAPSTEFIEANLTKIQRLAEGDMSVLEELQDLMAQDFVMNLEYKSAITGESKSAQEIQNNLLAFLDQLDTSVTIGEEVTIDQSYYDTLQEMLDSGQLAAEDLQKMMRMKGFEMEITGWKEVKGPETTTYQNTYSNIAGIWVPTGQKKFVSSEAIQVPIVNGDASNISSGKAPTGSAPVVKATGAATLDKSTKDTADKNAGKEKNSTHDNEQKNVEDEAERYHEIKEVMDDLSRTTEQLGKAKDRAFGAKRIALINAEVDALDAEIAAQDELIRQQEEWLAYDKEKLSKFGAEFDEDGRITNYDEMYQKEVDTYNQATEKYNKGQMSEEDYSAYEERYENFTNSLESYEESVNDYEDSIADRSEKEALKLQKKLEGIDYAVTVRVELNDRELATLERTLERLNDDSADGAARIANMTKQMDAQFKNIETYSKGIDDVLTTVGATAEEIAAFKAGDADAIAGYEFTDEQITQLEDYVDGIIDAETNISELRDSIEGEVMATFDAWDEKIDATGEKFSTLSEITSNYRNIIDLVGKDTLGIDDSVLQSMDAASAAAAAGSVTNAKASLDATAAALKNAQDQLANAADEESAAFWQDTVDSLNTKLQEEQATFTSTWQSSLEECYAIFDSQVERAAEKFQKSLAGVNYSSLEDLSASMERTMDIEDQYLSSYEKLYNLNKMSRDLQAKIDSSDSVAAKQAMKELQDEINAKQAEGVEMSQYDLDYLQKKYDLKMAEIALEEAQNAKSQVRLTRNSEGGMNFVYTADESKVADAQSNYEDKLFEIQQLNQSYIDEIQNNLVANQQAWSDAITALWADDTKSAEEKKKLEAEINEYYAKKNEYYYDELNKAIGNNKQVYEEDAKSYYESIMDMELTNDGWVTDFSQTAYGIATGFKSIDQAQANSKVAAQQFSADLDSAYKTLETNVGTVMNGAGVAFEGFSGKVSGALGAEGGAQGALTSFATALDTAMNGENGVVDGISDANAETEKYKNDAIEKFGQVSESVGTWQEKYSGKVTKATEDTNALDESLKDLEDKMITVDGEVNGKDEVDQLKEAIDNLKTAIDGIKSKDVVITTKYQIYRDTSGDGDKEQTQDVQNQGGGDVQDFSGNSYADEVKDVVEETEEEQKNWWQRFLEWCGNVLKAIGDWFVSVGVAIGDFFTKTIPEWWGVFTGWLSSAWQAIKDGVVSFFTETIPNAWHSFTAWISNAWTAFINGLKTFFTETIPGWWNSFVEWIKPMLTWDYWANLISALFEKLGEIVGTIILAVVDFFTKTIPNAWNNFSKWITEKWQAIVGALRKFFTETMPNFFAKLGEKFGEFLLAVVNFFTKTVPEAWANFRSWLKEKWTAFKDWIKEKWSAFTNAISTFFTKTIPNAWNNFISWIKTAWSNFKTWIKEKWTSLVTAVTTFFKTTIPNAWNNFKTWISEKWKTFTTNLKKFFTETLPNTLKKFFTETIPNTWKTFSTWISTKWKSLKDGAVKLFTETIPNAFKTFFTVTLPNKWKEMVNWLKTKKTELANGIKAFFTETIPNFIKGAINGIKSAFAGIVNGIIGIVNKGMDFIAACYNNTIGAFLGGIKKVTGWSNIPDKLNIKHIQEVSFDTGGYTGEWGPEGRWAMLHQKEIVLNAADTENLLQAIELLREFDNFVDMQAKLQAQSLLQYQTYQSKMESATLEQSVTITAEFPNATDREEISAAFGDLVNLAAQYANRK